MQRRIAAAILAALALFSGPTRTSQKAESAISRLIGQVITNGQQMKYLLLLSDQIGSRLTGTANARRAEEVMEAEMKRLGLSNVRREPFTIPISWERGWASAWLTSHGNRRLAVASYTWAPGTDGPVEGHLVSVGAGRQQDVRDARPNLKGAVALAVPRGATLDEVISNFYRAPILAKEVKEAGAVALLIASDKQHAMLYTAPVDFNARVAALPTLSIAREDAGLLERLINQNQRPRIRLEVQNNLGPDFQSTNVMGEIPGRERPEEIVVVGAHLDSNDLGPGALDNAAGSAAVIEVARAIKALGLEPRRTIRFVLFMGEEEGMMGSASYVRHHRDELDRTIAALIMDIGAGRPLGWFSMGRTDLDEQLKRLMEPLKQFGVSEIEHAAFAATDNAPFMAEGIPNLLLLQDSSPYFPVHHTIADTPDKVNPGDYAIAVATLAATAYAIADMPERFGRRLSAEEVKQMAAQTKVDVQWRAAGIW
jgi:hypothetical protein